MSYYLETNTVRTLARSIRSAEQEALSESYTSFLTIFEILSGTTDKDFVIRRAILSDILNSPLRVDWRFPDRIISESFNVVGVEEPMEASLQRIADLYVESLTWEDALATCREQGQASMINKLLQADALLTLDDKSEQETKGRQLRKDYDKKTRKYVRQVIIESDPKKYLEIKNHYWGYLLNWIYHKI